MSVYEAMVDELLDRANEEFNVCPSPGRGGSRSGAGRKPMKPALKKQTKSFTLSPETVQALQDLQGALGLSSQSAVVEFLALRKIREVQKDLF